jgi:LysM repeat protein
MAGEAKLGLVFIGILLTVFSALLIKKLTKHGNLPPMSLNASATKSTEPGSLSRMPLQPSPPTLVKPLNENTNPPEFAADSHDTVKQNGDARSSSNLQPLKTEMAAGDSKLPSTPPPSLLAEPLPVAAVGERYKAPVPYRSSYAAAGSDDTRSAPSDTVRQEQPLPAVDPFPKVEAPASQPAVERPVVSTEPPAPYRQNNNVPITADVARVEPSNTNRLRTLPQSSSTGLNAANNDRYATESTSSSIIQNPKPTYNFTPRASIASDFAPPSAMSGVVTASAPPAGIKRNGDHYTVGPNDSFWTISEKAYGTGGYFKALFELNRKRTKDSEDLKVGEVLTVPDEAIIRRMYPDLCPKPRRLVAGTQQRMISASGRLQGAARVYTVVDGDTLFEIARHELGKPSRWAEIYELNHDVLGDDFDYLRPGLELILPAGPNGPSNSRGDTATRQPEAIYPR